MPVHKVTRTDSTFEIFQTSEVNSRVQLAFASLVDPDFEKNKIVAQGLFQDGLDLRMKRTDLPGDDPQRTTNPNCGAIFWDGPDIIYRIVNVTTVSFINSGYQPELARIRLV